MARGKSARLPLPAFLMKLIEKLKKTVEDTGEQKTN